MTPLATRLARIYQAAVACGDFCMAILCRQAQAGDDAAIEAIGDHFGFDIRNKENA